MGLFKNFSQPKYGEKLKYLNWDPPKCSKQGKKVQVFELGPPQKYRQNYGMVVPNGSGREPLGTTLRKAPFQMRPFFGMG